MIRKLMVGLGVAWWLVTPAKWTCPLCGERHKAQQFTVHMWVDHADGK